MLTPSELRGAAFAVLEQALQSEDWKEQLTAARIVLSKVDDSDEIEDGLDVYEAAQERHDARQEQRKMPDEEED